MPEGAAIAPVILATDKTQLTQFSGNKCAYPVYLTLGNIPRAIRRKPSEHACILIGYLPVSKVDKQGLTKRERKARMQKLFHMTMRLILKPLVKAGKEGVNVTGGDGCVRRVYPILASYVADYPEQCLVTCSKYGTCPKCQCPADKLEADAPADPRTPCRTKDIIRDAWAAGRTPANAEAICMERDVSGTVRDPFWADLPYADIHLSITPDVLHQLYQGVFKHIVSWCQDLLSPEELDRRLRCLPPGNGIRHFKNGISGLSQITGMEMKQMARVLLPCLVGKISKSTLLVFRSLLDFIYLAQYSTHDDDTLKYMEDALKVFHQNKKVLVQLGIRKTLNIPKFHSLLHYAQSIRQFGTTDNYNTEMFERLHIDFAKDAWRATNHRDEFPQMIKWITRKEKMSLYEMFQRESQLQEPVRSRSDTLSDEDSCPPIPTPAELVEDATSIIKIAKFSPSPQQHLRRIQERHSAPGFTTALTHYLNGLQPVQLHLSRQELARTWLPFEHVNIYHKFQLKPCALTDGKEESDVVKAIPGSIRMGGRDRFDNVIVLDKDEAESTGVQGMFGTS